MASWARPGVKCVCLEDEWAVNGSGPLVSGPKKGEICTVASWPISDEHGDVGLRLVGWGAPEDLFLAASFRPLVTQSDDVEMFLRIANDTPFHVMIDEGLMDPESV